MKYTPAMKRAGEMAMRRMSEKAQKIYNETDPLYIYEYEKDERVLYAAEGAFGEEEDMTFGELQDWLEDLCDEMAEEEA